MSATFTLWHKHMTKFFLNKEESLGMLIQPILWVVLFGAGMKGMMGPAVPGSDDLYIGFFAPGIIALSALGGAIAGGLVWLEERTRGIVKEYLVAPIPRLSILMANALSNTTKSLFQAVVIFVVAVLMGAQVRLDPLGWLGGLALVAGFGLGFSGIALAFASKAPNAGAYHGMIFILNLPLLFMSNALYPLDVLPKWMEIGARLNPTTYVVDGLREMVLKNGATLAGGDLLPLWLCFLAVAVFAVFGMWIAYTAFRASIK